MMGKGNNFNEIVMSITVSESAGDDIYRWADKQGEKPIKRFEKTLH